MELELPWLVAPDLPTSSWLGGLTLPAWEGAPELPAILPGWGGLTYEQLTATTLIYANGAGITMAAGTRLTLKGLAGGVTNYVSCLGKSACTPSQLGG